MNNNIDIKTLNGWGCPAKSGAPLLTAPRPLNSIYGIRVSRIFSGKDWKLLKKLTCIKAGYKCEACGKKFDRNNRTRNAREIKHRAIEIYNYDFKQQEACFVSCVALCEECGSFINCIPLLASYKHGGCTREYVLKVIEDGFRQISNYNEVFNSSEPLRANSELTRF